MIGIRYKSNFTHNNNLDINNFYNFGLNDSNTNKTFALYNQSGLNFNSNFFSSSNNNTPSSYQVINNLDYFSIAYINSKFSPQDLIKIFSLNNIKSIFNQLYLKF
jgi:hypothetical protein